MNKDFDLVHSAVKKQVSEFKSYFMKLVHIGAVEEFHSLPSNILLYKNKLESICNKEKEITRTYTDEYGHITDMKKFNESTELQRPLWKARDKYKSLINRCKRLLSLGEEQFVSNELNKAESLFDGKVYSLSRKLCEKSFSAADLHFSKISNDPKLFDVYISSGDKKVHARSILAAKDSVRVTTHFRFIITNAK